MNTKTLLKIVVVAGYTSATAFCLWQAFKIAKEYKEELRAQQALDDDVRLSKQLKDIPVDLPVEEPEPLREAPVASEGHSEDRGKVIHHEFASMDDPSEPVETFGDEDPEEVVYQDFPDEPEKKEVEDVRFPIDSNEAFNQYVQMRLSDLEPDDPMRRVLCDLFKASFSGMDEEDQTILAHILESRAEFFTDNSRWSDDGTVAEVLLYLAEQLDFDLDGGIPYWLEAMDELWDLKNKSGQELWEWGQDLENHTLLEVTNGNSLYGIFKLKVGEMKSTTESIQQQYWDFCSKIMREES